MIDYLTSCVRVQTIASPVYMYDVAVVDLSFLHGLIRLTCTYTQRKNVYLQNTAQSLYFLPSTTKS